MDENEKKEMKWYHKTHSLIIGFLFVGPFILPLVWTHPQLSRSKKLIYTLLIICITLLLTVGMVGYMQFIWGQYEKILANY